jgi:hypothetical protein
LPDGVFLLGGEFDEKPIDEENAYTYKDDEL